MKVTNSTFKNTDVVLDWNEYDGCVFDGCRIRFSGEGPVTCKNSKFFNCQYIFSGPAAQTVQFLSAMYRSGATEMVDRIIEDIRSGGVLNGSE